MAGTIPLSMTQQMDQFGDPLAGGKLYLIQAGTVNTPQNGFQDSALTLPWPNPIILSASGRIPQFFLADGSIKIRLTDADGVEVPGMVVDGLIVTGASSGGGGGSPVDVTTVLATGDMKARWGVGVLAGFVRANGRTIGSATSGATERANADAQALFEYLWNNDINMTVSSGRGATSIADWGANKTITVPDLRGRILAGMDDMGNSAAGRLTSTYSMNAIVLGSAGGAESQTLSAAQIPAHTHTVTVTDPGHVHTSNAGNSNTGGSSYSGASNSSSINFGPFSGIVNSAVTGITAAANANTGGGGAHTITQPTIVTTFYLKL